MQKKSAKIIDGKKLADKLLLDLKDKIAVAQKRPGLATVLIGADPASKLYVRNKQKAAEKIGLDFYGYYCGVNDKLTQEKILEIIDWLNQDPAIDGIIVQLPIPKQYNTSEIIGRINPDKDVDGFHPHNKRLAELDQAVITPPLIAAVMLALKSTREKLTAKTAVIVAKNPIFSEPLKKSLAKLGLTVSIITPDAKLGDKTKSADVLIAVVGKKNLIQKSMVKPGAIVIDIGTNYLGDGEWVGDVADDVTDVAGFITPVPGGIGPLTVAMLLKGTYELSLKH
ncbi:MAG: bifunctional 5,10-methylenetetrahydrofolate dehydrogenase/5,10-methenyltetrahydrofolate cyclohydrolase [Patescibacteria group bacterium]|nr:bifunctional 5,10-methylenetetrahydrofolate dehydrogenase/5,10-methenyltetrahydrofolate cyclohydrolase [Patescibacteria group bacterium]